MCLLQLVNDKLLFYKKKELEVITVFIFRSALVLISS